MGQATRTTKLPLDFGKRTQGGINTAKRAYLDSTVSILNQARTFYVDFLLTYCDKVTEQVTYFSDTHQEYRERLISTDVLLTWVEACTVSTPEHPTPLAEWNFTAQFPGLPALYRRSL